MGINKSEKINLEAEKKRKHDILAGIRFLEHLFNEILIAEKIEDIKDKNILNKFKLTISQLKKELKK
ncbi:hypothetical protein [Fluviispira multicolorata]|uniref:Uncharacterized protein n=1 Tax=Fluviispira multicolorata TaxID=2654512 RepID=A0A833JEQ3_9BACT|nr:hypothetical protein [Fluviispira multicolorata]KAB8033329.1 hypothetical protein GCL57_01120 [Fluviispira multicolorata]